MIFDCLVETNSSVILKSQNLPYGQSPACYLLDPNSQVFEDFLKYPLKEILLDPIIRVAKFFRSLKANSSTKDMSLL